MQQHNEEYERYQRARKQVEEIKGFYVHFIVYLMVMGFLIYINLRYTPGYLWFLWSMFGWGIGVAFHAIKVFGFFHFFDKDWEERKIKEFLEKEKQSKWK
ncbi:2TM domain-containing protein [Flavobacterium sp.]